MDYNHCSCSGKSLARLLQPAVMAVLAGEALHGYLIAQRLKRMKMFKDRQPDPTGLYRLLKSMEEDGLVKYEWDLADSGPAKRRYELTADGYDCLAQWTHTLTDYNQALAELLKVIKKLNIDKKT